LAFPPEFFITYRDPLLIPVPGKNRKNQKICQMAHCGKKGFLLLIPIKKLYMKEIKKG
jgi:hypothetical protein